MAIATGTPENPYSASLAIVDDTGLTITVTTGGTDYAVKGTPMAAGSTAVGLTASATDGTITVPVGASGRYRVSVTGVALPTNSKTALLRLAVDGTSLAVGAGGAGARIVGAASALEEHFAFESIVEVDASSAAKVLRVNVTSTSNSDTVNFKRFNFAAVRIGA